MSIDRYASLKQGLVGCWIPSISGSGLLLPDLSGRGNNGTLTNMDAGDWVSGQYGRALDFDNSNDFISLPNVAYLRSNQPFTLSWWERVTANTNPYPARFRFISATNTFAVIRSTQLEYSTVSFSEWRGVDGVRAAGTTLQNSVGKWQHFVIVGLVGPNSNNTTDYRVYENANSLTLAQSNIFSSFAGSVNQIGYDSLDNGADCLMDDIRIYSRALTEPEIKLLASEPGIGYKPAKKLSRFSQRYTYEPPPATQYGVIRQTNRDHANLREGLVGAWCPSIAGSGLTLPDLARNNHGTLTNMGPEDWVSGQYGRALDFDGVNDYVNLGSRSLSGSASTISAWVRLDALNQNQAVLDNSTNAGFGYGIHLRITSANVLRFWNYDANTNATGSTVLANNQWYHVSGRFNGSGQNSVFVNGQLDGQNTGESTNSVTGTLSIGTSLLLNHYLDGQLDDIRIYSRALTEPEIKLLASRPGIGLVPQRKSLLFQQQQFSPAWSRRQQLIGSGVY